MAQFNTRIAPPRTKWHHASVETEILGRVLRAAIGEPVADHLDDRIWGAIGTEADAWCATVLTWPLSTATPQWWPLRKNASRAAPE